MSGAKKGKKAKNSTNSTIEIMLSCANANCEIDSEEFITCSECKSIFHPECNGFDPNLYRLLMKSENPGLSWLWRCKKCIMPGDFLSQMSSTLNSVGDLILKKFNDLKTNLDKTISSQINKKVDEIKKGIDLCLNF